jgi:TolA-binding protein
MDRQQRHDLKHDKFIDELGELSGRARANQRLLLSIAGAVLALALIIFGVFFYRANREEKAQGLLATAIETIESPLLPETPTPGQPPPPDARFKTEAQRAAAAEKEFLAVRSQYPGSDAADIAGLYLGRMAAARGDVKSARTNLESFIDEHSDHLLVGGARYSLLQLRIDSGEAQQVVTELNAELAKAEPSIPGDAILNLLAYAYEVQGNATKARETYRRIVTEFPESPYTLEAQRRVGSA